MPTHGDEFLFDENFFRALARGDAKAENRLVAHFSKPVLLHLRARLRSEELVEDAREEIFLRVLRYFRAGKVMTDPAHLTSFVDAICHHVSLEFLRARSYPA
jgi:DNA-directed RNA polymerase specialized sigma24 family protein